jgi:curved DNA-binding protein CbpA
MTYTFEIDPAQVLGVRSDASLEQIRDAYRARSKKYHPDLGGDEWAFRLVARSYEVLSRARVSGRLAAEAAAPPPRPAPTVDPVATHPSDSEGASVRKGVRDHVEHPALLVDVELLLLRMELENPYDVIALPASERNLSCSLNVVWPIAIPAEAGPGPDRTLIGPKVAAAFNDVLSRSQPTSSWQDEGATAFKGWLSYSTAQRCYGGFNLLRNALKARGLGVNQRIREIVIPRDTA